MTTTSSRWKIPASMTMLLEQSERWQSLYRPLFFRLDLDREQDQVWFSQLLESGMPVLVYDQLQGQLGALITSRSPHRMYSQADLEQEVSARLADTRASHYGVWVYYPWSGRLVHLLDEREFVELKTMRNLYKITTAERKVLAQKKKSAS